MCTVYNYFIAVPCGLCIHNTNHSTTSSPVQRKGTPEQNVCGIDLQTGVTALLTFHLLHVKTALCLLQVEKELLNAPICIHVFMACHVWLFAQIWIIMTASIKTRELQWPGSHLRFFFACFS